MDGLNLYDQEHSYRYAIIFVFSTSFKGTTLNLDLNTYSNYPFPLWGFQGQRSKLFQWNITWLRIPTGRRRTSWLFASMAKNLSSELPRTNPASDQGVT